MKKFWPAIILQFCLSGTFAYASDKAVPELPDSSILQIEGQWRDQDGRVVSLRELSGNPTVFAMAFTSCQYACPIITSAMLNLEKRIREEKIENVRFMLISLDPKRDTPERLKKYASSKKLDPKTWRLLTSNESTVRELAVALGINFKNVKDGDIAHSNVIFFMDRDGVVKAKVIGLGKSTEPLLEILKKS